MPIVSNAVKAELSYLVPDGRRPVQYAFEPPSGEPWESGTYEAKSVPLGDARMLAGDTSIDREGFECWDAPTALQDFRDTEEVSRIYYPELETLALSVTGGHRAYVFDHLVRERTPVAEPLTFGRSTRGQPVAPNGRIHTDYTEQSGRRRLERVLGDAYAATTVRRFCIINIWRSLRGPVVDTPLAVCDARTVDVKDLIDAEVRYPRRTGEIYLARYSPRHLWWYYSALDRHEALIFKQYDSQLDGVARFVPHAAFSHPHAPAGALPRISIEARCLVVYRD